MQNLKFEPEQIPKWFSLPSDLFHDFHDHENFPKGFKPPKNKVFVGELLMPYNTEPINNRNPLLACGFTHVSPKTRPWNTRGETQATTGRLVDDTEWCDINDGMNTAKWSSAKIAQIARNAAYMFLDYEHQPGINAAMIQKMAELNKIALQNGSKMALWAQGLVQYHPMYMPITGQRDLKAAQYWANFYKNPTATANPIIYNTGVPVSMPFGYYTNSGSGEYLYGLMHAHEVAKLINPKIISLPTLWIQQEHVEGYKEMEVEIPRKQAPTVRRTVKLQAPASYVYGTALWGAVWDGWYHFEEGTVFTDDPNYASEEAYPTKTKRFAGVNISTRYLYKYFGFYNYVYLALWQMSQPHIKPIIEADGPWLLPEFKTKAANSWRTKDERLPSYCHLRVEPIIRYKWAADGKSILIIAQNPYNIDYETVTIRDETRGWQAEIILEGGWPTIGVAQIS